jgi:Bacterial regulatory protein, Fis family
MRFYGGRNLAKAERDLVLATLKQCSNNRVQTAKVLGMPRSTLDKKLKQYAASGVPVPPAQNGGFRAARRVACNQSQALIAPKPRQRPLTTL